VIILVKAKTTKKISKTAAMKKTKPKSKSHKDAQIYFSKTKISYPSEFSKFDLHIHSKFSSDAVSEPETIIKRVKAAGLKGFAITDHNTIRAWPELARLAKQNNIVFVPGQEIDVTFEGKKLGHLLALFTYDKIASTEILDVVDDARSQSALLSFPHPFDTGRYFRGFDYLINNGPISRFIPAMETFNSRVLTSRANEIAKDFAQKHGLLQTAGSDAHMPYEIGNGYLIAKAQTELELLKEIKLGRVVVNGELAGMIPRIHTLGAYLKLVKDKNFK
jgi:predicted metal-dependent phosphoesterase TrpH